MLIGLEIFKIYYPPLIPVGNFFYLLFLIDIHNTYYQIGLVISIFCLFWIYFGKMHHINRFKKSRIKSKVTGDLYIQFAKDKPALIFTLISISLFLISFYHIFTIDTRKYPVFHYIVLINLIIFIIIPPYFYYKRHEILTPIYKWVRTWL